MIQHGGNNTKASSKTKGGPQGDTDIDDSVGENINTHGDLRASNATGGSATGGTAHGGSSTIIFNLAPESDKNVRRVPSGSDLLKVSRGASYL